MLFHLFSSCLQQYYSETQRPSRRRTEKRLYSSSSSRGFQRTRHFWAKLKGWEYPRRAAGERAQALCPTVLPSNSQSARAHPPRGAPALREKPRWILKMAGENMSTQRSIAWEPGPERRRSSPCFKGPQGGEFCWCRACPSWFQDTQTLPGRVPVDSRDSH